MLDLPVELLYLIFYYLNISDLKQVIFTSKTAVKIINNDFLKRRFQIKEVDILKELKMLYCIKHNSLKLHNEQLQELFKTKDRKFLKFYFGKDVITDFNDKELNYCKSNYSLNVTKMCHILASCSNPRIWRFYLMENNKIIPKITIILNLSYPYTIYIKIIVFNSVLQRFHVIEPKSMNVNGGIEFLFSYKIDGSNIAFFIGTEPIYSFPMNKKFTYYPGVFCPEDETVKIVPHPKLADQLSLL